MKLNKTITILLTLFVMTSAGISAGENLNTEQVLQSKESPEDFSQVREKTILDSLDFLSTARGPGTAEPGETINIEIEADPTASFNLDGKVKVVEFYRCNDSGCDDPDQDEFLEAKSSTSSFDYSVSAGNTIIWDVDYTVPEEEGYYAAVGYISDGEGGLLTDSPKTQFTVGSPEETTGSPDIQMTSSPSFKLDESANRVTGTIRLGNFGDASIEGSNIVEMQVREGTQNPLSAVSVQGTCDQDYPNNVHKEYSLNPDETESITLQADSGLEDGQQYTVYFLTRSECGGDRVEPIEYSYNAGTFTFDDSTTDDTDDSTGDENPSVVQVSKPALSFEDGTVTTEISFKNNGGAMSQNDIVEMQVRPKGQGPLAFSSSQQVCDEQYPNNVHREFRLDAGETANTKLSTDLEEPGEYEVFLLTRDGCFPDNDKVDPYYNSVKAGEVQVNSGLGGFVTVASENPLVTALLVLAALLGLGAVVIRYI